MAEIELNADTILSIPAPVMSRLVGDETVLLDLASGMYFGLDGVGQRVWESVAEGKYLGEIATIIASEFEIDEEQAFSDLIDFTRDLAGRGLLEAG
jgi:hypothetical protein